MQATQATTERLLESATWNGLGFVDGWRPLHGVAPVIEPATGQTLGRIGMADAADITAAAASARRAAAGWIALPYEARTQVMRNAAQILRDASDEIVDWIVRESGSTTGKAHFEVGATIKAIDEAAALPSQPLGHVLATQTAVMSFAKRVPLGVVGVIAPFNFPLFLAMRAVAPALALGNAVVLKPDPRTAVCGGFSIARIFEKAGLPTGVLQVLPGAGDAGEALCSAPDVAMIQFTGSTKAGRMVGQTAGRHLKKVSLELGGKNSLIILEDADIDLAVKNATFGAFFHQGQICMATGRVLVHSKIVAEFTTKLAAHAATLRIGNPASEDVAIGPIIDRKQLDGITAIVDATVAAGATLVAGGTSNDLFYAPTVIAGVRRGMPAFENEVFGPVALVTPFDTDDEAVELANDTEYGLSAAIISSDIGRALKLGDRLRTGALHINDQTVNDDVINPFGGVGASGNGTSVGGLSNADEYTQWRWITVKSEAPAYPM